jgi:hypothetical protein
MIELMSKKEADGMKLSDREHILHSRGCEPVEPQYCIVWEEPSDLDASVKVTTPSPQWLGGMMHGNFSPDVSAYIRDRQVEKQWINDNPGKTFSWEAVGGATHPYAETVGAMTEEEAMEFLLQKDIPSHIWMDDTGNAPRYKICKLDMLPNNRTFRGAWRLAA